MCVIAGYIGEKSAAPILMEMLRKEEGLDAGFYTGIATIHEGKLHYRKVVGDVAKLLEETDALELPGNIGIAHSRTPSGGGREWGHPFTDPSEKLAYIANGSRGRFGDAIDLSAVGNRLLDEGATFRSTLPEGVGNPSSAPLLRNGKRVHVSDLVCQLIAANFQKQESSPEGLMQAVSQAYEETVGEIVGLCIHADQPDTIVIGRINQPMEIGRGRDGSLYLATTTIAFPKELEWEMRMAPLSGAVCHRDGSVQIAPFRDHSRLGLLPLGPFPSSDAVMERVKQAFAEKNPLHKPELDKAIDSLWPEGTLRERSIVVYELLAALLREGKISLMQEQIPGMFGQGTVPRTFIRYKGN